MNQIITFEIRSTPAEAAAVVAAYNGVIMIVFAIVMIYCSRKNRKS